MPNGSSDEFYRPGVDEAQKAQRLGELVLERAAQGRDARGDSDLYDEQPVVVTLTLGELRKAGLRYQEEHDDAG